MLCNYINNNNDNNNNIRTKSKKITSLADGSFRHRLYCSALLQHPISVGLDVV